MKTIKFKKEIDGKWFAVIPEYNGPKADLEMVQGADIMLNILAQEDSEVIAILSTYKPDYNNYTTLTLIEETPDIGGGIYLVDKLLNIEYNMNIWLCDVTRFVFKELPKIIYLIV